MGSGPAPAVNGTDTANKGTDNANKGTDNANKGTVNGRICPWTVDEERARTLRPSAQACRKCAAAPGRSRAYALTHLEDLDGALESDVCGGGGCSSRCRGRACTKQRRSLPSSGLRTMGQMFGESRVVYWQAVRVGFALRRSGTAAKQEELFAVPAAPLDLQHAARLEQDHRRHNREHACKNAPDDGGDGNSA
jgi:hypothetical protein